MSKKNNRRKATTLIELIVVIVMMGLFIMMVFNMFSVTYDAYLFNSEMAAKMYAQTNADNFFEIFKRELMYSGSMESIIKGLPGLSSPGSNTELEIETTGNDATITTRYALAEKIILSKAFQNSYDELTIQGESVPLSESNTTNASQTFFALYNATFPSTATSPDTISLWSLGYDSIISTPNTTDFEITEFDSKIASRTDDATFSAIIIKQKDGTPTVGDDLQTFISPLLYEKSFKSINNASIELDTDKNWTGEIIYKTQIYTIPQEEPKDPNKKTLVLNKYIPTVDASYTIKLMDDVISFQATELSTTTYIATVTYGFGLPGTTEEGSITVSRKFLKNIQ